MALHLRVLTFTYRAHPLTTVLGGLLIHPQAHAGEVLRTYRDFMETAPDELTAYAAMLHTPACGSSARP